MALENLTNKPLVEAIFEIRWYTEQPPFIGGDPNTQLILGRLFDRINENYPIYEQLPFASIPEQMAEGIVKHRFKSEKGWPLVQLGNGILTVNDTENYIWQDFKKRIIDVVDNLYIVHPSKDKFRPRYLILKYIDAIDLDLKENEFYEFLKNKMKIELNFSPLLFEKTLVTNNPIQLDLQFAFPAENPKGIVNFRIVKGQKFDNQRNLASDALIWETTIQSTDPDIPEIPSNLDKWLENAHSVCHNWFFTLVDGDLLRRFE
ncbi:TIGR04255 family protein [Anabaena subtropica]|uniref:TIGR04255 family protein n=1 Tax=Anabaena subtropica FACHB-260 TaxID=2692884 RepID=A0ABR8CVK3_9NOST|nr:TIGR04255 family protein [Anabaena subtropica]MBD2346257.1 TIGR04255 family protein [Anabaena subtropica FACHB-260]